MIAKLIVHAPERTGAIRRAITAIDAFAVGGVGLNLTAADYVIHYDPWWNPAVEMQASDRTHRIGQDKHVFVYKFITRKTVEEKVLELQQKKRKLVEQLITTDRTFFKQLTRQDIEVLFT